jgi:hypothetical protein
MKTIEVTDEQYEFLKEAKNLLATQDNRCTRDPLYCIMEKTKVYGFDSDYSSNYCWIWDDSILAENTNEIFQKILEYTDEEALIDLWENKLGFDPADSGDEVIKGLNDEIDNNYILDDWLSEKNIYKVWYNEKTELCQHSNIFSIFEKDALEYCESKNSKVIWSYAGSTWRAKRMVKLIEIIKNLQI